MHNFKHGRLCRFQQYPSSIFRFLRIVYVSRLPIIALFVVACHCPANAQPLRQGSGGSVQQRQDEMVDEQLAKAWKAYWDGKYPEGMKLAEPLVNLKDSRYVLTRFEAVHVQARCCWSGGTRASQAQARRLWEQLSRMSDTYVTTSRIQIARALMIEADAQSPNQPPDAFKLRSAIEILEPMVKGRWDNIAVEASLDLARMYCSVDRYDDAKKLLNHLQSELRDERRLRSMEIPKPVAAAFMSAAQAAAKQLTYDKDAGKAQFEAAELLRQGGKYVEAVRAYQGVAKGFAQTSYGPLSELRIGDCLCDMGYAPRAIDHWKKFVSTSPAGPWRAQALVRIIDFALEDQLDIAEAGKYADIAHTSLPTGLANENAADSWKSAEFDIFLRIGIVSLCQGQGQRAATAFEAAGKVAPKKGAISLDALVRAGESGSAIIPEDCLTVVRPRYGSAVRDASADKPALALSMGVVYLVAGRLDNADAFFSRVLGGGAGPGVRPPLRGATPAQLSFAAFGKGAVLQAKNQHSEARELFMASIKGFAHGSWHDETLCRLAILTQEEAYAKYPKPRQDDDGTKPGTDRPATPSPQQNIAEKQRLVALAKARADALSYWKELIRRYPQSPRCEYAMYNAGGLMCELAEASDIVSASSESAWQDAAAILKEFCQRHPDSRWAGDASVRQVDIALERLFEIDTADAASQAGVAWAEHLEREKDVHVKNKTNAPWQMPMCSPTWASLKPVMFNVYQRAALVAHLKQQRDQAIAMCHSANKYDDSSRKHLGAETRMDRMIAVVEGAREALTPQPLVDRMRHDKQRTALLLADLALLTFDPVHAGDLYEKLLLGKSPFPKPNTEVECYLLLRTGQSLEFQRKHEEAIACLGRLYDRKYAKYPWAVDGIFRLGTWSHNATQDPSQAMKHWKYVFVKNPDHPEAERSLFYYGLTAMRSKDYPRAAAAFSEYLKRYPNSRWTPRVASELLPEAIALDKENKR